MSEKWEKCSFLFPIAQCVVFKLCLLSKQQPKTQRLLIYDVDDTEKKQILTFKTLNQQVFVLFYLKNDWNDYSII